MYWCTLTDMEYKRRNISLPSDMDERLRKEGNASATIVSALNLYYRSKETTKRLVQLVEDFEGSASELVASLGELDTIKRDIKAIKERVLGY